VWVYAFSDGTLADGTYWFYYNGAYYYPQTTTTAPACDVGCVGGSGLVGTTISITDGPCVTAANPMGRGCVGGNWSNENIRLAETIANGGSSSGSNYDYCMALSNSSTDWDYDGVTGVTELGEHCSGR